MSIKKLITFITLTCFMFSLVLGETLHAAVELNREQGKPNQDAENLIIPSSYGRITEYEAGTGDFVVMNIQDLHCHPEVQRNISKILGALDKEYGLDKVYVEGGYGGIDTSRLCNIKGSKHGNEILDELIDEGRLTGSEYYSAISNRPDLLKGLEDESLHKANIVRLGKILDKKDYFEGKIKELNKDLEFMKAKYFSSRNKSFNKLLEKHGKGGIESDKYYKELTKYAKIINDDSSKNNTIFSINIDNYPNINTFLELNRISKQIKYKKLSRQLPEFIQLLKKTLPYSEYNDLLTKTENFSKTEELYLRLAQISKRFPISQFPGLYKFFDYILKNQNINPVTLIQEEKRLTEEIRLGLSKTTAELEISFLSDFYTYFQDFLLTRLSADDYEYFTQKFEKFKQTWGKYTFKNRVAALSPDFELLNDYYKTNSQRNETFINNISPVCHTQVPPSGITPTCHSRMPLSGICPVCHSRMSLSGICPVCHTQVPPSGITPTCHSRMSLSGICPACHSRMPLSGICPVCHSRMPLSGICPVCHSRMPLSGICPACHSRMSLSGICPACHSRMSLSGIQKNELPNAPISQLLNNSKIIVMVTGGFHTKGLKRLFHEKNISYLAITPNITTDAKASNETYTKLIKEAARNSLAIGLAAQLSSPALFELAIKAANKKLKELKPTDKNALIDEISKLSGVKIKSYDKDVITFDNGAQISLEENSGRLEARGINPAAELSDTFLESIRALADAEDISTAISKALAGNIDDFIKIIFTIAAKNNMITGNGLIYEISNDKDSENLIDGIEKEILSRFPERLQKSIYAHYKNHNLSIFERLKILLTIDLSGHTMMPGIQGGAELSAYELKNIPIKELYEKYTPIYGGKGFWLKVLKGLQDEIGGYKLPKTKYITIQDLWEEYIKFNQSKVDEGNKLYESDMKEFGAIKPETVDELEDIVLDFSFSDEMENKADSLMKNERPIFRSSGRQEDGFTQNLSGLFSSVAREDSGKSPSGIIKRIFNRAILDVIWSEKDKGVSHVLSAEDGLGIVLQDYLYFESAGTAMTNKYGRSVIEAVFGGAEMAVRSSFANTVNILIDKKTGAHEFNPSFLDMPVEIKLNGKYYSRGDDDFENIIKNYSKVNGLYSPVTEEQAMQIYNVITALEKRLSFPLDVEWGFKGGKLYIVQIRPQIGDFNKPLSIPDDDLSKKEVLAKTPIALGQTTSDVFTGQVVMVAALVEDKTLKAFENEFDNNYMRLQNNVAARVYKRETTAKVLVDPYCGSVNAHCVNLIYDRIANGEFCYANGPVLRSGFEKLDFIPSEKYEGIWISKQKVTYFSDGLKGSFYIDSENNAPALRSEILSDKNKIMLGFWHDLIDKMNAPPENIDYGSVKAMIEKHIYAGGREASEAVRDLLDLAYDSMNHNSFNNSFNLRLKRGQFSGNDLFNIAKRLEPLEKVLSLPLVKPDWESKFIELLKQFIRLGRYSRENSYSKNEERRQNFIEKLKNQKEKPLKPEKLRVLIIDDQLTRNLETHFKLYNKSKGKNQFEFIAAYSVIDAIKKIGSLKIDYCISDVGGTLESGADISALRELYNEPPCGLLVTTAGIISEELKEVCVSHGFSQDMGLEFNEQMIGVLDIMKNAIETARARQLKNYENTLKEWKKYHKETGSENKGLLGISSQILTSVFDNLTADSAFLAEQILNKANEPIGKPTEHKYSLRDSVSTSLLSFPGLTGESSVVEVKPLDTPVKPEYDDEKRIINQSLDKDGNLASNLITYLNTLRTNEGKTPIIKIIVHEYQSKAITAKDGLGLAYIENISDTSDTVTLKVSNCNGDNTVIMERLIHEVGEELALKYKDSAQYKALDNYLTKTHKARDDIPASELYGCWHACEKDINENPDASLNKYRNEYPTNEYPTIPHPPVIPEGPSRVSAVKTPDSRQNHSGMTTEPDEFQSSIPHPPVIPEGPSRVSAAKTSDHRQSHTGMIDETMSLQEFMSFIQKDTQTINKSIHPIAEAIVAILKTIPAQKAVQNISIELTEKALARAIEQVTKVKPDDLGKCVTGDTLLPILKYEIGDRKKEIENPVSYSLLPISSVKSGDYVLSLNEKTQKLELHRINALLDMGVKPVYKLTTKSGRTIRTTANHPYLAAVHGSLLMVDGNGENINQGRWVKVYNLKVGDRIVVPVSNNLFFNNGQKYGGGHTYLPNPENKHPLNNFRFHFCQFFLKPFFGYFKSSFLSVVFNFIKYINEGFGTFVCKSFSQYFRQRNYGHNLLPYVSNNTTNPIQCQGIKKLLPFFSQLLYASELPKSVADIFFDEIASIKPCGREQVYDIEVEGTHNFIGNGIIAHNTYANVEADNAVLNAIGSLSSVRNESIGDSTEHKYSIPSLDKEGIEGSLASSLIAYLNTFRKTPITKIIVHEHQSNAITAKDGLGLAYIESISDTSDTIILKVSNCNGDNSMIMERLIHEIGEELALRYNDSAQYKALDNYLAKIHKARDDIPSREFYDYWHTCVNDLSISHPEHSEGSRLFAEFTLFIQQDAQTLSKSVHPLAEAIIEILKTIPAYETLQNISVESVQETINLAIEHTSIVNITKAYPITSKDIRPDTIKGLYEKYAPIYGGKGFWLKILEALQDETSGYKLPRTEYIGIKDLWGEYIRYNQSKVDEGNRLYEADKKEFGKIRPETKKKLDDILSNISFSQELENNVKSFVKGFGDDTIYRSSYRREDYFTQNLAGIFKSIVIDARSPAILIINIFDDAIRNVIWNKDDKGVAHVLSADEGIGIILQDYKYFESAGTAMTNKYGYAIIEAAFGDSGMDASNANTVHLLFNKKTSQYEFNRSFPGLPFEVKIDGRKYSIDEDAENIREIVTRYGKIDGQYFPLTEEQAKKIYNVVTSLEKRLGFALDVEWGFKGGELYIVQIRPQIGDFNKSLIEPGESLKSKEVIAKTPIALGQTDSHGFSSPAVMIADNVDDKTLESFEREFGRNYIRIENDVAAKVYKKETLAKVLVDPFSGSVNAHCVNLINDRIAGGEFCYTNGPVLRDGLLKLDFIPHEKYRGIWVSRQSITYFGDGLKGIFYLDNTKGANVTLQAGTLSKQHKMMLGFYKDLNNKINIPLENTDAKTVKSMLEKHLFSGNGDEVSEAGEMLLYIAAQSVNNFDFKRKVHYGLERGEFTDMDLYDISKKLEIVGDVLSLPLIAREHEEKLIKILQKFLWLEDLSVESSYSKRKEKEKTFIENLKSQPERPGRPEKLRVLLINRDSRIVESFKNGIESHYNTAEKDQFEILTADDIFDAVDTVTPGKIDYCITDIASAYMRAENIDTLRDLYDEPFCGLYVMTGGKIDRSIRNEFAMGGFTHDMRISFHQEPIPVDALVKSLKSARSQQLKLYEETVAEWEKYHKEKKGLLGISSQILTSVFDNLATGSVAIAEQIIIKANESMGKPTEHNYSLNASLPSLASNLITYLNTLRAKDGKTPITKIIVHEYPTIPHPPVIPEGPSRVSAVKTPDSRQNHSGMTTEPDEFQSSIPHSPVIPEGPSRVSAVKTSDHRQNHSEMTDETMSLQEFMSFIQKDVQTLNKSIRPIAKAIIEILKIIPAQNTLKNISIKSIQNAIASAISHANKVSPEQKPFQNKSAYSSAMPGLTEMPLHVYKAASEEQKTKLFNEFESVLKENSIHELDKTENKNAKPALMHFIISFPMAAAWTIEMHIIFWPLFLWAIYDAKEPVLKLINRLENKSALWKIVAAPARAMLTAIDMVFSGIQNAVPFRLPVITAGLSVKILGKNTSDYIAKVVDSQFLGKNMFSITAISSTNKQKSFKAYAPFSFDLKNKMEIMQNAFSARHRELGKDLLDSLFISLVREINVSARKIFTLNRGIYYIPDIMGIHDDFQDDPVLLFRTMMAKRLLDDKSTELTINLSNYEITVEFPVTFFPEYQYETRVIMLSDKTKAYIQKKYNNKSQEYFNNRDNLDNLLDVLSQELFEENNDILNSKIEIANERNPIKDLVEQSGESYDGLDKSITGALSAFYEYGIFEDLSANNKTGEFIKNFIENANDNSFKKEACEILINFAKLTTSDYNDGKAKLEAYEALFDLLNSGLIKDKKLYLKIKDYLNHADDSNNWYYFCGKATYKLMKLWLEKGILGFENFDTCMEMLTPVLLKPVLKDSIKPRLFENTSRENPEYDTYINILTYITEENLITDKNVRAWIYIFVKIMQNPKSYFLGNTRDICKWLGRFVSKNPRIHIDNILPLASLLYIAFSDNMLIHLLINLDLSEKEELSDGITKVLEHVFNLGRKRELYLQRDTFFMEVSQILYSKAVSAKTSEDKNRFLDFLFNDKARDLLRTITYGIALGHGASNINAGKDSLSDIINWLIMVKITDEDAINHFLSMEPADRSDFLRKREDELKKISHGNFDLKNPYHLLLGYEILFEQQKNQSLIKKKISFKEFKDYINSYSESNGDLEAKDQGEIIYLCSEALRLKEFIKQVKEKADQLNRPLVVIENLTYGWMAALPIEDELSEMGIKIIRTKAGSTYAHDHPVAMHSENGSSDDVNLLKDDDLKFLVENEPVIVVIDGTYSLDPEKISNMNRRKPRFPDAHQVWRNIAYALSGKPDDSDFGIAGLKLKNDEELISESLKKYDKYIEFQNKVNRIKIASKRPNYKMFFWYPGKLNLEINSENEGRPVPEKLNLSNSVNPKNPLIEKIDGPALIFAVANMEDESVPQEIRRIAAEEGAPHHNSAYFDDKTVYERMFIKITKYGPAFRNIFDEAVRKSYKKVKKLYEANAGDATVLTGILPAMSIHHIVRSENLDESIGWFKSGPENMQVFYSDLPESAGEELSPVGFNIESGDKKIDAWVTVKNGALVFFMDLKKAGMGEEEFNQALSRGAAQIMQNLGGTDNFEGDNSAWEKIRAKLTDSYRGAGFKPSMIIDHTNNAERARRDFSDLGINKALIVPSADFANIGASDINAAIRKMLGEHSAMSFTIGENIGLKIDEDLMDALEVHNLSGNGDMYITWEDFSAAKFADKEIKERLKSIKACGVLIYCIVDDNQVPALMKRLTGIGFAGIIPKSRIIGVSLRNYNQQGQNLADNIMDIEIPGDMTKAEIITAFEKLNLSHKMMFRSSEVKNNINKLRDITDRGAFASFFNIVVNFEKREITTKEQSRRLGYNWDANALPQIIGNEFKYSKSIIEQSNKLPAELKDDFLNALNAKALIIAKLTEKNKDLAQEYSSDKYKINRIDEEKIGSELLARFNNAGSIAGEFEILQIIISDWRISKPIRKESIGIINIKNFSALLGAS